jgi:hypothetical protein
MKWKVELRQFNKNGKFIKMACSQIWQVGKIASWQKWQVDNRAS